MWLNTNLLSNEPDVWESLLGMVDDPALEFEAPVVDVSQAVSYAITVMDKTFSEVDQLDQRIKALLKQSDISQTHQTRQRPTKTSALSQRRVVPKRKVNEVPPKRDQGEIEDTWVDIMTVHDDQKPSPVIQPAAAPAIDPMPMPQIYPIHIKMITEEWTSDLILKRTEEIAKTLELVVKQTKECSLPDLLEDALNMEISDATIKIRLVNPPPEKFTIKIIQADSRDYMLKTQTFIVLDQFFERPVKAKYQITRLQKSSCIELDLKLCN